MIRRFCMAVGLGLLLCMPVKADFSYSLAFTSDGSAPADFFGVISSSVTVPVYLVETGTQGAGPAGLDTLNLFGSTSSITVSNASVATPTSLAEGAGLNAALTNLSGAGPFTIEVGEFLGAPGAASTAFVGGRSVKIGDLTFSTGASAGSTAITLGAGAGGTFNYSLRTPSSFAGTAVNGNASSFQTANIITAVPEPSSFAVLGLTAGGLLVRRRRKA